MKRSMWAVLLLLACAASHAAADDKLPKKADRPFALYVFAAAELQGFTDLSNKTVKEVVDSANDVRKALRDKHKDWFVLVTNRDQAEIILEIKSRGYDAGHGYVIEASLTVFDLIVNSHIIGQGGLNSGEIRIWSNAARDMADRIEVFCQKTYDSMQEARRSGPKPAAVQSVRNGDEKLDAGDYPAAIAAYDEALRVSPSFTRALNNRGLARERSGDLDGALADFTLAVDSNPKVSKARTNRGRILTAKKECDKAIEDFTASVTLNAEDGGAWFGRGLCWGKKGEDQKAVEDYTRAIRLDAKDAVSYFNRGLSYSRLADADKTQINNAIQDFSDAIALDPKDPDAYFHRASALQKKGLSQKAADDFSHCLSLDPKHPGAHFGRGFAHGELKLYDKAIADYTEAIALDPNDAVAYYNRGLVYQKKGLVAKAAADKKQAVALDPSLAKKK